LITKITRNGLNGAMFVTKLEPLISDLNYSCHELVIPNVEFLK